MTPPRTEIFADPQALAQHAADWIAGIIAAHDGAFRIALAGGNSPRLLYSELAVRKIDWRKVQFYWIDERLVPPDDPDSNLKMARETLLAHIAITPDQIHAMPTAGDAESAARAYQTDLQHAYGAARFDPARPLFDFTLIGLGDDGHICSLLPGSPVLDERLRWVAPVTAGRPQARLTLTYPAVESSRLTVFLVTGSGKADAVKRVRHGDHTLPGGRLHPQGDVVWLLDRAAASLL